MYTLYRQACVFSFRHHSYKKVDGQIELSEVGPRFEMKGLFCLSFSVRFRLSNFCMQLLQLVLLTSSDLLTPTCTISRIIIHCGHYLPSRWLRGHSHDTGMTFIRERVHSIPLCRVQFYLLPPPPRAHPRGFAIFFLLGGLFPTPGHAERDNSPPPVLLIDHRYVVLCSKYR